MRCSILLAASLAMGAWAQTPPPPPSQEELNRALELLRKTPVTPPPPAAKPGVPLKVVNTPLTTDMEQRAREVLQNTKVEPQPPAPATPAAEAIERAQARDEL